MPTGSLFRQLDIFQRFWGPNLKKSWLPIWLNLSSVSWRSNWSSTFTRICKVRPQFLEALILVSKVPIVKSNMCQVVLRRDPFDEQTEGQASKSSSWDWEQFAKYLPIGRFWERSIGRNRIGFPHINICQVFLRDLEQTHTHTQGGRAGPLVLGARSDMWRKEGPNTMAWVATAGNCICIVLHSTSWLQSYLYCIVLYGSTWVQSPDLSEMKSVSGTNGGGVLPPLGTFSALNELGLFFKCVCLPFLLVYF